MGSLSRIILILKSGCRARTEFHSEFDGQLRSIQCARRLDFHIFNFLLFCFVKKRRLLMLFQALIILCDELIARIKRLVRSVKQILCKLAIEGIYCDYQKILSDQKTFDSRVYIVPKTTSTDLPRLCSKILQWNRKQNLSLANRKTTSIRFWQCSKKDGECFRIGSEQEKLKQCLF